MIINLIFFFGDKIIKERNMIIVFYDCLKVFINFSFVIMEIWINGVFVVFLFDILSSMIGEGFE